MHYLHFWDICMENINKEELIEWLKEKIKDAREEASESRRVAYNSYGAGYDRGELAAFEGVLREILGKEE